MRISTIFFILILFNNTILAGIPLSERPHEIQEKVRAAHANIKNAETASRWREAGKWPNYNLMLMYDLNVVDYIIKEALINQPSGTVRFMDFGSGVFSWPLNVAKHILKNYAHSGLKFEIFGLTGEKAMDDQDLAKLENDNSSDFVRVKLLQQNEIESVGTQFTENNFDLIVSRWTMRHLVDPMGTLQQLHKILKVGGWLFFDGFYFATEPENLGLRHVLFNSNVNMLFLNYYFEGSYDHYLLEKTSPSDQIFSVQYTDSKSVEVLERKDDNASGMSTVYTNVNVPLWPKSYDLAKSVFEVKSTLGGFDGNNNTYSGDPILLQRAANNNLFGQPAQILNFSLANHPSKLVLEIGKDVEDQTVKQFGSAIIKGIMNNWRFANMPFKAPDLFSLTMEEREFFALILHESFADELAALGYTDVKIEGELNKQFEGCHLVKGCSKDSYWPVVFREKLLLPTLEYLRLTKQIASFVLLPNGNITIGKEINF